MSRIFLSHSSRDSREAIALKRWLGEQDSGLADEIFLDIDSDTGLQPGVRWKDALRLANARCEAVICLLSQHWEASQECKVEYRTAENLNKQIFCARLDPSAGLDMIAEWQQCDLFGDGPATTVDIDDGPPVVFATEGLHRLRDAIRAAGIGAESFRWPPPGDPGRAPYRGWEPFEEPDAAVFFGRDSEIVRALDAVRGIRLYGVKSLFVVLGPSGTGKSSFLRAGLLPRLRREDRRFVVLDIVRPERNALTGETGLARAIHATRHRLGLTAPTLGGIKAACTDDPERVRELLAGVREAAAARLLDQTGAQAPRPTLVLPLDQAEELFSADAGAQAGQFLALIGELLSAANDSDIGLIVAATIRTDRYELMQTRPELAGVETELFDELKPMPATQFKEVITGPAARATAAGHPLRVAPDLVERLLADCAEGADTLPMLSLTLARLFTDYGSSGELTLQQYEALGGMRRVVQTEVDELLATDPEERRRQLDSLRSAFIPWLATINPANNQPMRRVSRFADLPEASRPLVEAFVAKRLMVKDERDGQVVVEVALESLLRQWDELAGWLREQRQDLISADDLERAYAAWEDNDRDEAWLVHGTRLADAEKLFTSTNFSRRLAVTRDYLAASREREDQRLRAETERRQSELRDAQERQRTAEAHAAALRTRSRILRVVLAVTAVVAVVAVVAAVQALAARSQAQSLYRQATALRLEAQAKGMLADTSFGSDTRAFQQILAAGSLVKEPEDGALYSAVVRKVNTRKIAETLENLNAVAVSPDGRRLVTGSADASLRLWNADTLEPIGEPLVGHQGSVSSVVFSPDGRRLASGSADDTVRLWDADSGQQIGVPLSGHQGAVSSVVFSSDGRRLASGSADATVRLWDVDSGKPIGVPLSGHQGPVLSVAFGPGGRRLASGGGDDTVRLWDADSGQQIGVPLTGHQGSVSSVVFSPDGRRLASASHDDTLRVWDPDIDQPLTGHQDAVRSVAFSPDGRRVVSGSVDKTLRLWDANAGKQIGAPLTGHQGAVFAVAFSPDGSRMASGGEDQTVRLWDAKSGKQIGAPLTGHQGPVFSVAFSPDGSRLASGGDDTTIRLWDTATGRQIGAPLTGHQGQVLSVAFSPDGRRLGSGGRDKTIRLWDGNSGKLIGEPLTGNEGPVYGIAFSPDGRRLASGSDDGNTSLASELPGDDRAIRLWDNETGKQTGEPLTGQQGPVFSVAFSPDGHRLASASLDRTVQVWDADTGTAIGDPLTGHADAVFSVAFSPDGQRLASGSRDKTVRLWPAVADSADLCDKLTANMSHQQWRDWVSADIGYVQACPGLPVPADQPHG